MYLLRSRINLTQFMTRKIITILRKEGILERTSIDRFHEFEHQNSGNVLDFMRDREQVPMGKVTALLHDRYSLPVIDLSGMDIPMDVVSRIPQSVCREHSVVAFSEDMHFLFVAMADTDTPDLQSFISQKVGKQVKAHLAPKNQIMQVLDLAFSDTTDDHRKLIQELIAKARQLGNGPEIMAKEMPIIQLLNQLILFSLRSLASDLHIEPRSNDVRVRIRKDGMLQDAFSLPKQLLAPLAARVKILSHLRIDEHMRPQDGRFSFEESQFNVAVRVSIVPTLYGAKVALRFLDTNTEGHSIQTIGLSLEDQKRMAAALSHTFGLIVVCGPTGSGKTTTLYAMLNQLKERSSNIFTIEDPIEYHLRDVNQMQVNPSVDLTFANGLRSILRQDPDIIMVGEIRDKETAQIAINAALTGHIVVTSLHTNSASAAIPRLLDMGIEPFLLASILRAVIGQRLVRTICPTCHKPVKETQDKADSQACGTCLGTGYHGRTGLFEVMLVSDPFHDAIMSRSQSQVFEQIACAEGMQTMLADGKQKTAAKLTTQEEILRVMS